jgi:RNA polymerase sigma factor (sigma-70 family)
MAATLSATHGSAVATISHPRRSAAELNDEWSDIYLRLRRDREDVAAWRAVADRVRVWARAQLGRRGWEVVEEAVAETCATMAVSLDRARGADTFRGFACCCFWTARRRVLLQLVRPHASLDGIDVAAPAEGGLDRETLALLRRCLEALPPRERTAVRMRFLEEASSAAIAAALGVSEVNARQLVFRGLARLRPTVAAGLAAEGERS